MGLAGAAVVVPQLCVSLSLFVVCSVVLFWLDAGRRTLGDGEGGGGVEVYSSCVWCGVKSSRVGGGG